MPFYDTFLKSTQPPKQYWKQGLQALVDVSFENASTYQTDVEEENEFGSLDFHNIICRITSIVDAKTGQRVNDDYKEVIFPDIDKVTRLGTRFKFDNNIWICYSTDNIKTDTSSVYVRRCNNVLGTEDRYGNIHYEPCYIDYKVNETQLFQEYTMTTPAARIVVSCQVNEHTKKYNINDRFVISGQVYRIREFNRFDRTETFNEDSTSILSFHADVDSINDSDRFDIGIADYFKPAYKVIAESNIKNIVGYKNKIDSHVELVDSVVDEPIYYESTDTKVCKVNQYNGEYEFTGIGSCKIYCKLFNNMSIYDVVDVECVAELDNEIRCIITPDVHYIKLNNTQSYTVYSYQNNNKLDSKFIIKAYDVPENVFDISTTDNGFTIKYNRLYEDGILKIVCTDVDTNVDTEFYIELGGIW